MFSIFVHRAQFNEATQRIRRACDQIGHLSLRLFDNHKRYLKIEHADSQCFQCIRILVVLVTSFIHYACIKKEEIVGLLYKLSGSYLPINGNMETDDEYWSADEGSSDEDSSTDDYSSSDVDSSSDDDSSTDDYSSSDDDSNCGDDSNCDYDCKFSSLDVLKFTAECMEKLKLHDKISYDDSSNEDRIPFTLDEKRQIEHKMKEGIIQDIISGKGSEPIIGNTETDDEYVTCEEGSSDDDSNSDDDSHCSEVCVHCRLAELKITAELMNKPLLDDNTSNDDSSSDEGSGYDEELFLVLSRYEETKRRIGRMIQEEILELQDIISEEGSEQTCITGNTVTCEEGSSDEDSSSDEDYVYRRLEARIRQARCMEIGEKFELHDTISESSEHINGNTVTDDEYVTCEGGSSDVESSSDDESSSDEDSSSDGDDSSYGDDSGVDEDCVCCNNCGQVL